MMEKDQLKGTGLESVSLNAGKVSADDKRIINCESDTNQLLPLRYPWAWTKYINACANHWMPTEINMNADAALWKRADGLTEQERKAFEYFLAFAVISDSVVGNNLVFVIHRFVTNPECRQYISRQIFEESLHVYSYQHIIESLGMQESNIYNLYREVPCIANKIDWALKHTRSLAREDFKTGTKEADQQFLKDLVAFYVVYEGLFFYVGFVSTFALGRRNKMSGSSEQYQYIFRDESMHVNFGIDVINQIAHENPHLWTKGLKQEIKSMIKEGVALESEYAKVALASGMLGLNAQNLEQYLKFIANRRCMQLGINLIYKNFSNPFPWMSEMLDLKKEKNFFETRVTEYQTGGALEWG